MRNTVCNDCDHFIGSFDSCCHGNEFRNCHAYTVWSGRHTLECLLDVSIEKWFRFLKNNRHRGVHRLNIDNAILDTVFFGFATFSVISIKSSVACVESLIIWFAIFIGISWSNKQ